jgi:UDP-N-acetylglucosamine 2-epimerase
MVHYTDPVIWNSIIWLKHSLAVITDSGGITGRNYCLECPLLYFKENTEHETYFSRGCVIISRIWTNYNSSLLLDNWKNGRNS